MGSIKRVRLVKPICAVTFTQDIDLSSLMRILEKSLGRVEDRSLIFEFNFTDYYKDEMGENLKKQFISFQQLINPGQLAEMKIVTNKIEKSLSSSGLRRVNLDPGYITGSKLVLASTKDFAHRIYLKKGIYGDLQLQYRHDRFWPQQWTYPDYRTKLAMEFFTKVRNKLIQEEKDGSQTKV